MITPSSGISQLDQDITQLSSTLEIQHTRSFLHLLLDILQHLRLVLLAHLVFLLHVGRRHLLGLLAADDIMDRLDDGLRRDAVCVVFGVSAC